MASRKSTGSLIGTVIAIVIIGVICWPIIKTLVTKGTEAAVKAAVSNSYSVYLTADVDNVAHPRDMIFVFNDKIARVEDGDIGNIIMVDTEGNITRVNVGDVLSEGVYEKGVYMKKVDTDFYVVELQPGDSLAGLMEVTGIHNFSGYAYYGHLEKCDVYVER